MITLTHLTKSFNGLKAVDDLNLSIQPGEYMALLGPNGAGKTTLVEMIEGLQTPTSGEIIINNRNWQQHADALRRMMGISLQETKFVDKLTVGETLDLFGSFYHLPKSRTQDMLQAVKLEEKRNSYTSKLSGGQRQRLALGVALMNEPQLLLLDEPTTGLDPNARREIWDILSSLRQKQPTTMILTTHYMEEAQHLCDRIVIMDRGKILADGTLEDLLDMYNQGEIISFRLDQPLLPELAQQIPGLQHYENLNTYHAGRLVVDEITSALPVFLAVVDRHQLGMQELECRKKTLDDLFVSMTGRRLDA